MDNEYSTGQENQVKLVETSSEAVVLHSPTAMPKATGYLYNEKMLLQLNCRGYAVSQFLQPEPAKYSHEPNLTATTFIQPEHHYFAHHPGRFFYIKDLDNDELYSLPYEPTRVPLEHYSFIQKANEIVWQIEHKQLLFTLTATLSQVGIAEHWRLSIENKAECDRNIVLYPYFTIGYQSWMNQSAQYRDEYQAIVASAITPYQKIEQYFANQELKDNSFLMSMKTPDTWLANQNMFEGEGGLAAPDALLRENLANQGTQYQVACACMQYKVSLSAQETYENSWLFGAIKDDDELALHHQSFMQGATQHTNQAINNSTNRPAIRSKPYWFKGAIEIAGQSRFFHYVNQWLPRQIDLHGTLNRLTTDPQTRNYFQDNMGLCYIAPEQAKQAFITALSQQSIKGEMPDGILINEQASLKYINQVPHSDHSVWLAICLLCYLDETNDSDILTTEVGFGDSRQLAPVITHVEKAINYLLSQRDNRGLCLINQGDWCDPMNMVGHGGKGVSSWLSLAVSYSISCYLTIIERYAGQAGLTRERSTVELFSHEKAALDKAVNTHCWDGDWYARGINDNGRSFGVKSDKEGQIYLNPQSWALLAGAVTPAKRYSLLNAVHSKLHTPYGVMMLAPSYLKMDEGIGRITQKSAGVAENGSIYNHASAFYAYALYLEGENDLAFEVLSKMLPSQTDQLRRGQLPHYVPNYYRGAYHQFPEYAGQSSHLFNTGTIAWFYRCVIEHLCGFKGEQGQLRVAPQLPKSIEQLRGVRRFLGAEITFDIQQKDIEQISLWLDGEQLSHPVLTGLKSGERYQLTVHVPRTNNE